jgi:hypothetical protein
MWEWRVGHRNVTKVAGGTVVAQSVGCIGLGHAECLAEMTDAFIFV